MDIPRPSLSRRRRLQRIGYGAGGATAVIFATLGLARLKPAAPSVDRATVWIDTVKRGPMLSQVRGLGSLVPEAIRWIPAATEGRVERIVLQPGAEVKADSVLLELSNPELELAALDAESHLKEEEAQLAELKVRLESAQLDQESKTAKVASDYHQAKLQAEADEQLARQGLFPPLDLKKATITADELANRMRIEQKRLEISWISTKALLAVQQAKVNQRRAESRHKRSQVNALKVRAGIHGVVQQIGNGTVPLEVGQWVTPGTNLARVAEPDRLRAVIKIAETQARDVEIGQRAEVDTRNGVVPGHVIRVDPASQQGTVTVDLTLDGPLPRGARPDLTVDGTIELERLNDVLYVGRPAGRGEGLVALFKLDPRSAAAIRVKVKLGKGSVNAVEILEGLKIGDQVVLSDTSQWDAFDRIRLN
jgi:HlyD family secretion protein